MTSTALQAADSLATNLIHRIPSAVQPAFAATVQYYQTKALINISAPLLLLLFLIPIYNHYLAIFQSRIAEAKDLKNSYFVQERTFNLSLYKGLAAAPFIVLSIILICNICAALPFFLAPQVATALALLKH